MEAREARRAAEKAARERLAGPLISATGELGAAIAHRQAAAAGVGEAQDRARDHVRRAHDEADQMVATARQQAVDADERYRHAHDAALAAGWAPAALADMGYPAPATPRKGRGRTSAPPDGTASAGLGDEPPPQMGGEERETREHHPAA